jgi:hypothetical protein
MSLDGRPPRPKGVKVSDKTLCTRYRKANQFCEVCWLNGRTRGVGLELHHLIPGYGRTDEIWNLIMLCHECHMLCTEHIHGVKAKERNLVCWVIKWFKSEVSITKLIELDLVVPLRKAVLETIDRWNHFHPDIKGKELS